MDHRRRWGFSGAFLLLVGATTFFTLDRASAVSSGLRLLSGLDPAREVFVSFSPDEVPERPGPAFLGAAFGYELRRRHPDLKIHIVPRTRLPVLPAFVWNPSARHSAPLWLVPESAAENAYLARYLGKRRSYRLSTPRSRALETGPRNPEGILRLTLGNLLALPDGTPLLSVAIPRSNYAELRSLLAKKPLLVPALWGDRSASELYAILPDPKNAAACLFLYAVPQGASEKVAAMRAIVEGSRAELLREPSLKKCRSVGVPVNVEAEASAVSGLFLSPNYYVKSPATTEERDRLRQLLEAEGLQVVFVEFDPRALTSVRRESAGR